MLRLEKKRLGDAPLISLINGGQSHWAECGENEWNRHQNRGAKCYSAARSWYTSKYEQVRTRFPTVLGVENLAVF